jgi:hypothetical protein
MAGIQFCRQPAVVGGVRLELIAVGIDPRWQQFHEDIVEGKV